VPVCDADGVAPQTSGRALGQVPAVGQVELPPVPWALQNLIVASVPVFVNGRCHASAVDYALAHRCSSVWAYAAPPDDLISNPKQADRFVADLHVQRTRSLLGHIRDVGEYRLGEQ
jgi:hypothetical protein